MFVNEQLKQLAAVDWDGTKKKIELKLSLCYLKPAVFTNHMMLKKK